MRLRLPSLRVLASLVIICIVIIWLLWGWHLWSRWISRVGLRLHIGHWLDNWLIHYDRCGARNNQLSTSVMIVVVMMMSRVSSLV